MIMKKRIYISGVMQQPMMSQSDCIDCKLYEGFGQCYEHGNNLIDNCIDYRKE